MYTNKHTDTRNDEQNDQFVISSKVHYVHLVEIKRKNRDKEILLNSIYWADYCVECYFRSTLFMHWTVCFATVPTDNASSILNISYNDSVLYKCLLDNNKQ